MAERWQKTERRARVADMTAAGGSLATIARALGVSVATVSKDREALGLSRRRARVDAEARAKRDAEILAWLRAQPLATKTDAARHFGVSYARISGALARAAPPADPPSTAAIIERDRAFAADRRSLTARAFGDPLPGRSALDRRAAAHG